nr:MAG TPA: hypothetical protein [Caudoviricetes sp.]
MSPQIGGLVWLLASQRFDKYEVCNYYTNKKAPPMNG